MLSAVPTSAIASHEQLLTEIRNRYGAVRSATLSVDVTASAPPAHSETLGAYSRLSGYILLRKPDDLRIILFVPIAHIRALDMVSNHEGFRLAIPAKRRYLTGTNREDPHPAPEIEGLRPQIIRDALLVRAPEEGETSSFVVTSTGVGADNKKMIERQQYLLSIHRTTVGSTMARTERTILLDGLTHLPITQEIYRRDGTLGTRITYDDYRPTELGPFPTVVTIWRPKEHLRIVFRLRKVAWNQTLADDQFEMNFPEGARIETLP